MNFHPSHTEKVGFFPWKKQDALQYGGIQSRPFSDGSFPGAGKTNDHNFVKLP